MFSRNLKRASIMKKLNLLFTSLFAVILLSGYSFAQDAAKVDPKHYKVEFENDQVRVLRITYGPGEKSIMHTHPEGMAIFLTDGSGKFTFPDGKTVEMSFKAGDFSWLTEQTHQPENTGDKPFELIQIEMKNK
jgi:quercetin dioxygenase-like cupin family protein